MIQGISIANLYGGTMGAVCDIPIGAAAVPDPVRDAARIVAPYPHHISINTYLSAVCYFVGGREAGKYLTRFEVVWEPGPQPLG